MTAVDDRVGVVIPCHATHRWPQLVAAVESVRAQTPRPAQVVVTVDHNDELLDRARRELAGVTVVANGYARGAAGNRNTGIAATDTPLIALLDDDATARPGWLAALVAPFDTDDVIGTGGTIEPRWARPRPVWFPDEFLCAISATNVSPAAPTTVRNVWSARMAMRREAFEAAGAFRVGFAPRGDGTGLEDTDLCLRMSRAVGGRWVHVPDAVVDHTVPAERTTLRYLLMRCFREGRGKVELARLLGGRHVLDVERAYLRGTVTRAVLRGLGKALSGKGSAHAARAGVVVAGILAALAGGLVAFRPSRAPRGPAPLTVPPRYTIVSPVSDPATPAVGARE
ncbi:MAG: glycosyltransferase [Actinobacteria bacterium]|nr:MAG: glycosyltransferase [Actinomycetota bacterium]